ncbi:MAG: hypothetical protein IMZ64_07465 [Bacteroidetes bacterium]|nr:hypothetical protein [Bacteroidota bacterium]
MKTAEEIKQKAIKFARNYRPKSYLQETGLIDGFIAGFEEAAKECTQQSKNNPTPYLGLDNMELCCEENEVVVCPDCGKYKRLPGNGVILPLCECGSGVVCAHPWESCESVMGEGVLCRNCNTIIKNE